MGGWHGGLCRKMGGMVRDGFGRWFSPGDCSFSILILHKDRHVNILYCLEQFNLTFEQVAFVLNVS